MLPPEMAASPFHIRLSGLEGFQSESGYDDETVITIGLNDSDTINAEHIYRA